MYTYAYMLHSYAHAYATHTYMHSYAYKQVLFANRLQPSISVLVMIILIYRGGKK